MDSHHCELFEQTLDTFLGKLKAVTTTLRRLVDERKRRAEPRLAGTDGYLAVTEVSLDDALSNGKFSPRRLKYAMNKRSLDQAIQELETWQGITDHSWFLIMKMANPQLDAAIQSRDAVADGGSAASIATTIPAVLAIRAGLQEGGAAKSGITFGPEELARLDISPIPFCDAKVARRKERSNGSTYILNSVICSHFPKYQLVKKDTRDLVRKLQHDEPHTFGLLSCKGFVVERTPPNLAVSRPESHNSVTDSQVTFTMIFRAPIRSAPPPCSLRDLLLRPPPPSLSTRFEIARELAKSVSYVHSFGFVHKNIRPEAVLRFIEGGEEDDSAVMNAGALEKKPATYCLVGFENFRHEDGWTQRRGDDTLERNLYRHPSRQGSSPREDYVMQHDIYSLGVCLLEVGLWTSFINYQQVTGQESPTLLPALSASLDLPIDILDGSCSSKVYGFLETIGKDHLVSLARARLPGSMGSRYTEIVETCLTCLDPENADFGDAREFEDADGIRVGVRYIEKVSLDSEKWVDGSRS
jgi:hypothetical protein